MASERIQRQIDRLLDEPKAIAQRDWALVQGYLPPVPSDLPPSCQ